MKKRAVIFTMVFFSIYMSGCAKKETAMEEAQEPISMEELTIVNNTAELTSPTPQVVPQPASRNAALVSLPATTVVSSAPKLQPLPPAGPYKPTVRQIQTALKNAGYYFGTIDGKIGPLTKGAIEKFQKANGLKADAKIWPKTWGVLGKYLNPPDAFPSNKR